MPESDRKTTRRQRGAALTERPIRMTLSRALELALSRKTGASSTVTLSRNSKGETQIEVSVATGDGDGLPATPLAADAEARRIYNRLCEDYPRLDGLGAPVADDA